MNAPEKRITNDARDFLDELTALSKKHKIGIAGDAILYAMEWEDQDRSYSMNDESRIELA